MELPVLYEDSDVLVINKPAGLITHSDGRTQESSVVEWALARYPSLREVGDPWVSPQGETILRSGIVHRLDRGTSGVMILAKTNEAHAFLKQQFEDRTAEKRYRTLVYGHPAKDAGVIEVEIVRIRSLPPRWGVARAGESRMHRAAITEWHTLSRSADPATGEKAAYLEVRPKTGRTHQIRVHLKHLGYPVVCDPLYAKGRSCLFGFARPALHAFSLSVVLPSGERSTFEAPLPDDFRSALTHFPDAATTFALPHHA